MHLLHFFLSEVASLNSARFIPVLSCISSIPFFLGRPLFFFPSPQANIISFSSPSARMTCPKNPSFLRRLMLFVVTTHHSQSQSPCALLHLSFSPSKIFSAFFSISTFHKH